MIQDVDKGYKNFLKHMEKMAQTRQGVAIGIIGDEAAAVSSDRGINNATLGAIHEFGSADGHVPERSFLRATVDANDKKYTEFAARVAVTDALANIPLNVTLGKVGELALRDVTAKFRAGIEPALSPVTQEIRHGNAKPLWNTGQLLRSITWGIR